jgi:SAM-dependent methyltransferase
MMPDPFSRWLGALQERHFAALNFQEVRRAVQALSVLYVERRNRIGEGSALDGAGKRAAFASYFAPLHFLLVREIVRALDAAKVPTSDILDLGCGTGIAGAAWALEMNPQSRVTGIDRNSWAAREAKWTYGAFHLRSAVRSEDLATFKIGKNTAVIAAFSINELSDEMRTRMRREMLSAARHGSPVLVIEPIARSVASWWPDWATEWIAAGGREDEWRFSVQLPETLALMDKSAGLDHRELTGRSLWIPQQKV